MIYELTNETLLLILFFSLIIWFWITWLIITSAVKSGIKSLTNLMKKDLELKGVSKEELNELCGIEADEYFDSETQTVLKRDKDGKVVGYEIKNKSDK